MSPGNDEVNSHSYGDRPIWLTSLAEADRHAGAPAELQSKLVASMARKRRVAMAKRAATGLGLAAALTLIVWMPGRMKSGLMADSDLFEEDGTDVVAEAISSLGYDDATASEFIPTRLASAQPLESVRLVRMSMPTAALAAYGVAPGNLVQNEEVTADLLVGQDGIARAVRVIR